MKLRQSLVVFVVVASALGGCSSSRSNGTGMFRVPSKDGTLIAVECAGAGPSLIMVHGGIGDRTRWTPMFPLLSSHFTVCAMDPRQMRALAAYRFDAARMRTVRIPTLVVTGSDTASPHLKQAIRSLQASLPHPTLVVLEGQQHNAMDVGRQQLAEAIINFLLAAN